MNEEPTIEELKALIEDLKRQLALALDAVVARSGRAADTGGCSAFAAIRRTKYPHEYAGWNVERDSPKWTSDRLFAAPVPLETLVSELNKVAAIETNIWAVVYHQDTPPMNTPETPIALAFDAAIGRGNHESHADCLAWSPIETAPDIGKRTMLVFCSERRNTYTAYREAGLWFHAAAGNRQMIETPTHWMPLPPLPNANTHPPRP